MVKYAIAVDLGGTQLRAALIDSAGQILERDHVPTDAMGGPEAVIAQIERLVKAIAVKAGAKTIQGVGVSSPGPLDTEKGVALSLPTITGFTEYAVGDALRSHISYPVVLENDGISAAIGEWRFGAGIGFSNIVYVTVSTGIGGGVIVDGRVMRGRRGMAGHVGHMIVVPDGDVCGCGTKGCFEAYGAGPAFTARACRHAFGHATTILGRGGAEITSPSVFAAAKIGDQLAQELVAEEAKILGMGFASLFHLYSPDILIMGGGLSNEFDMLAPGIATQIQLSAMPAFKSVPVVKAKLGGNSGLVGAASLVFQAV